MKEFKSILALSIVRYAIIDHQCWFAVNTQLRKAFTKTRSNTILGQADKLDMYKVTNSKSCSVIVVCIFDGIVESFT